MPFRYFAYGSNMWLPRMRARCPSARFVGTDVLPGWRAAYDKPSVDGSAKLNIREHPTDAVQGVIYEIADHERPQLDAAEPGYVALDTPVGLVYAYRGVPANAPPADWYVALVEAGAGEHGLTPPRSAHTSMGELGGPQATTRAPQPPPSLRRDQADDRAVGVPAADLLSHISDGPSRS